jgi:hypothetical protein
MSQWKVAYPVDYTDTGDLTKQAVKKHMNEFDRLYTLLQLMRTNFSGSSSPDGPEIGQLYVNPTTLMGKVYTSGGWVNLNAFPLKHPLSLHDAGKVADLQKLVTDGTLLYMLVAPAASDNGKVLAIDSRGQIVTADAAAPVKHDYTKHIAGTMANLQSLVTDKTLVFLGSAPTSADAAKILSIDSTGAFVLTNPAAQTDALNAPYEKVKDWGTLSAATTLAASDGNIHTFTVGAAITLTLNANCLTGFCRTLTLVITNGGAYTVTWPASVKWAGGAAPTFSAAGVDVVTLLTVDGGTTWLGAANGVSFA